MTRERPIYFDNNSTTPVDPRVLAAMLPYFVENFGNPESAQHRYGWKAEAAVTKARAEVAALLNASRDEIIFTSGATESMNLAVFGYLEGLADRPDTRHHLISSCAEHKATLEICARAAKIGHEVTLLPVNRFGQVETRAVIEALRPNTSLVTLMHANNEVGSLNPIAEIALALRSREGIAFHVDAAQTVGKTPVDVRALGVDLLSLSAHKFYGPKGVGALFVRRPDIHLAPLMSGGGQERGLRGGTLNVPGIVGLGEACAIAARELETESKRLRTFQHRILQALIAPDQDNIVLNGHPTERICNNLHFSFRGIAPDLVLRHLSDFAFSSASACASGTTSHVLKAMAGASLDETLVSAARFGLGRFTSDDDVTALIERLQALLAVQPEKRG